MADMNAMENRILTLKAVDIVLEEDDFEIPSEGFRNRVREIKDEIARCL